VLCWQRDTSLTATQPSPTSSRPPTLALSTTTHLPPCALPSHCLVPCAQEVSKLRAALSRATAAATDKEAALGEARAQLARLGGQLEAAQGEAAALRRQLDSERCDHQVCVCGWLCLGCVWGVCGCEPGVGMGVCGVGGVRGGGYARSGLLWSVCDGTQHMRVWEWV
jgi:hypothetical protein